MKGLYKSALVLMLVVGMLLASTGCNKEVSSDEKVLTVLQGVDATTLDPGMHSEGPTYNVDRQIFDTLLDQNNEMKVVPAVAKDWEALSDTKWKFNLRDDVYFHDGVQLTAKDVKYSIERILNPENKSSQVSNFRAISKIELDGDFSLLIETDGPYPLLLTRLSALRVVPKHYVEEVGMQKFARNPIGSGPYKLSKWVKEEYIELVANESYWNGTPEVKKALFKPVPEAAARVMALQKGEADIIVNLPPHQVDKMEKEEGSRVENVTSTRFIMLPFTTKNKAVQDVRVRKAINYAIDVDSIISNIFGGKATPSSQPVCNFDLGYKKDLNPYGYNPEKAKELLKEAGYDGTLSLKMGSPNGRYIMDKEVAEAIKLQLEQVGIKVDLTFEEWGNYAKKTLQGKMDYDLWLIGWGSSTFDAGTTLNFWLNSANVTRYYKADDETTKFIDNTLNKALKTVNEEQRANMYYSVIDKVYKDAAFVTLYQQEDLYGVSSRLNWTARPDESIRLVNASWK